MWDSNTGIPRLPYHGRTLRFCSEIKKKKKGGGGGGEKRRKRKEEGGKREEKRRQNEIVTAVAYN